MRSGDDESNDNYNNNIEKSNHNREVGAGAVQKSTSITWDMFQSHLYETNIAETWISLPVKHESTRFVRKIILKIHFERSFLR